MQIYQKIYLLSFCFLLLCLRESKAQKTEIGLGLGATNYTGDVATGLDYRNTRLGGHAFFRYNASRAWSLRADLSLGGLAGRDEYIDDPFYQIRNFYFKGSFVELGGRLEYNFFNFRSGRRYEKWCPYLFGGISGVYYGGESSQQSDYNHINFAIPFGIGVKHALNPNWNLGFEFCARKMFADNLDGIERLENSLKYQEVNGESTDMYYSLNIYISYLFTKIRCPEQKRQ